jgi:tetratricopeptide (TPR) repeat protein
MKLSFLIFSVFVTGSLLAEGEAPPRVRIQRKSSLSISRIRDSAHLNEQKSALLAKKRKLLISELKTTLKRLKDQEQVQELQLRLANLYVEETKSSAEGEGEKRKTLEKASGILQDLAESNHSPKQLPEILFQLAQVQMELGRVEKALALFERLITKYPDSPYTEESKVQIGDYAFEQGDFKKALSFFLAISKNPASPLLPYSYYKIAWANYNVGKINDALETFRKIVEMESIGGSQAQYLTLKKEAIKDICLPFSDLKKYEEGVSFFKELGEDSHRSGMECLAGFALERGDYKFAIDLYTQLLSFDSIFKKNPDYSLALIDTYKKMGDRTKFYETLSFSLAAYLGGSTWSEIFSSDSVFFKETKLAFQELCQKEAQETHSTAQSTKNLPLYDYARKLYELNMEYFPLSPNSAKIEFYLAEILYKQGAFLGAGEHYRNVAKNKFCYCYI